MEYNRLGKTDVKLSLIGLGTMTWGHQNTEEEAHEQLDFALDQGINFIDTAEMYPVPPIKETYSITEQYIGRWLERRKDRDKIILATKMAGPRADVTYIRGGSKYNRVQINKAVDESLSKLKTDYIDLYQLHWAERKTNYFGKLDYKHDPNDLWENNIQDVLEVFNDLIKAGKVRYVGLSNETPWGVHEFLKTSAISNLPRIVSIQNPYNLLNRSFEIGLSEMAMREDVGLLAYSPLAFGVLTGKYYKGATPPNSRVTKYYQMSRYNNELARKAADKYVELAQENGMLPSQMALSYINSRPFLTSNIIGATTMSQLRENIESIHVKLSTDVLNAIERIHLDIPNPAP